MLAVEEVVVDLSVIGNRRVRVCVVDVGSGGRSTALNLTGRTHTHKLTRPCCGLSGSSVHCRELLLRPTAPPTDRPTD